MGCTFSEIEEDCMSLEFLVILKKNDFSRTFECLNKKNRIIKTLSKLPGNVRIGRFGEHNYTIKGLKMPYVLYTKLPKEGIYVTSDSWDIEYFNSQILELIHIFTALGAYKIKFESLLEHSSEKIFNTTSNLKIPNVPIKLSTEINNSNGHEESDTFGGLIKIKSIKEIKYDSVDDFIKKNKLYYTKFYPEWKNIIEYKMFNSVSKLDFEYTFHRGFHCSSSLGTEIDKIGVTCKIMSAINNTTTVSFKVNFQNDDLSDDDNES